MSDYLLEDASGGYLLEDASGVLLLEDGPDPVRRAGVYVAALSGLAVGTFDVVASPPSFWLVDAGYWPDFEAHVLIADVPGPTILAGPVAAVASSIVDGTLHVDPTTVTFSTVGPTADRIFAVLTTLSDGVDDYLLAYHPRRADTRSIDVIATGSDIDVVWSPRGVVTI